MRVVAVDWSGRKKGARRSIWLAEARDGIVSRLECGRTREEVADHLIDLAHADPALVVGFDFSFSFPAWFLTDRGFTGADDLWAAAVRDGEAWLAECESPFWGRPGHPRPELATHLRATEQHLPAIGGVRPKSTFQIGGAGSVGTGSVRGFPVLARLRASGFRIWPFHDEPGQPVAVEIYPRLFTGAVVKSRENARRHHLDEHMPELGPHMRFDAATSDDAFDALASAREMSRHAAELAALPCVDDPVTRLEGAVWFPQDQSAAWSRATDDVTAGERASTAAWSNTV